MDGGTEKFAERADEATVLRVLRALADAGLAKRPPEAGKVVVCQTKDIPLHCFFNAVQERGGFGQVCSWT